MSSNVLSLNPLFTPAQIQGCQLWLDAADPTTITTSGSTMTAWTDKSGTGKTVSFFNTNTYTANVSVNTNNGTSAFFRANVDLRKTAATYANIFTVHTWAGSATSATQSLWGADDGGGWNRLQLFSFPPAPEYAYGLGYTGLVPNVLIVSAVNTSSRTLYSANYAYLISNGTFATVNGTSTSTVSEAAASSQTTSQFTNFGASGSNANIGTVNFHEIIIYTSSTSNITTAQRQQVEGYLAWKWGLTGSLPANHPFKNNPPTNTIYTIPPSLRSGFSASMAPSTSPFTFFNPNSITSLATWLDATDRSTLYSDSNGTTLITSNGSPVLYWRDKSSNANNVKYTVSPNTPLYQQSLYNGQAVLTFSNAYFNAVTLGKVSAQNASIFAFYKSNPSPGTQGPVVFGNINAQNIEVGMYPNYYFHRHNNVTDNGVSVTDTFQPLVGEILYSDSTLLYYNNFSNISPASPVLGTPGNVFYSGNFNIGNYLNSTSYNFQAYVGEVLIYNKLLSTTERQQVEGYLAWKWGLNANLPASHPFKNSPPGLLITIAPPVRQMANRFWSPLNITGCQLWLDAADTSTISLSGTNVSQWNDKSGNARNASQGSVSLQPQYNNIFMNNIKVLDFTGKTLSYTPFSFTQLSVYLVFQNTTFIPYGWPVACGEFAFFYAAPSSRVGIGRTGATDEVSAVYTGILNTTTPAIFEGEVNLTSGTVTNMYWNGILRGSATTSSTGGRIENLIGSTSANNTTGYIAEVLLYNTIVTTTQRQNIEGYLAWKWGLQGNLPANHPWKRWPPPSS